MGQMKEKSGDEPMTAIPKVVHYCWFGGNPLGENELKCIASWKKFLPGYEIKRWDETNWDVRCCDYVSEAYDAKKWAFVSDYARFDILYRYGGVYFDTDVELIRPIDDILENGPFMGFETNCNQVRGGMVAAGLGLAANPGLGLYKTIIDSYRSTHFLIREFEYDQTTVVKRVTDLLVENGLKNVPGRQTVCGVTIYPSEYFNPKDFTTGKITITDNTRSIHHFSMSWLDDEAVWEHKIKKTLKNHGLGERSASQLAAAAAALRFGDVRRVLRKLGFGEHLR